MSSPHLKTFHTPEWRMRNPENAQKVSSIKNKLTIVSGPKTDWWRTAEGSEPESNVNRSSGPLRYFDVSDEAKHWKAGVWISGAFNERFKQATLFLGTGDYSAQGAWIKAGVEVEDGQHNIGCVASTPFSDWSVVGIKELIGSKEGKSKLYIQFTRAGADVFVHYAIAPQVSSAVPQHLNLLREIKGFAALAQTQGAVQGQPWALGVMVCGPLSEKTTGQWENFSFEETQSA